MSSKVLAFGLLAAPLSTGCSTEFEGTWLFQWDRGSPIVLQNDYCEEITTDTEYQGDEYEWIDIYTTTGGALVLTNGEQEWIGQADDDEFSVEATYGESDDDSYYQWNSEISASLDGEDLDGNSDLREIDCSGSDCPADECRRQTRRSFKAVKMEGTSEASRTIGTQSSQSASTN